MNIKTISRITAAALLFGSAAWLYGAPEPEVSEPSTTAMEKIRSVEFLTLTPEEIPQVITLDGATKPLHDITLSAQVSGPVSQILKPQGSLVSTGDTLMQIDDARQASALSRAQSELEVAEKSLARAQSLSKSGTLSDASLEARITEVERKKENLAAAQHSMDNTRVPSPISGQVVSTEVSTHENVSQGQPLLRVADNSVLIAMSQIPQSRISDIHIGTDARVLFPHGAEKSGRVTHIAPVADANTRSFPIEVSIENEDLSLKSGSTVSILIDNPSEPAFPVPLTALVISDDGQTGVYTLDQENRVSFHPVDILSSSGDRLIIKAEDQQSIRLVTKGHSIVSPGLLVSPIEASK